MKKRILIIDDDEALRRAIQTHILSHQYSAYEVDTAESGEVGIELHRSNAYDLIFLDLRMPGLNGVETLKAIRGFDVNTPIYIITAFYDEFFDELRAAQTDGFPFEILKKPVEMDRIVEVATSILNDGKDKKGSAGKDVLVIDDEEAIRKSFVLAFEDTDIKVDTAPSGERGIELVERCDYDLIFLDLKMPGLNGVETLRKIRERDREVPVYIITAFYAEFFDQLKKVADDGLQFEVMQKPLGAEEILLVAKSVFEQPQGGE